MEINIRGGTVFVDEEDAPLVMQYKWWAQKNYRTYYARRSSGRIVLFLHREIIGAKKGQIVDHINGNGLDNRKSNLRLCTTSQNQMNRKTSVGISRFKGVCKHKGGKWQAQINCKYLGLFDNEIDAAKAYDIAAIAAYGKFASLNFEMVK